LISLQLKTSNNFKKNLKKLKKYINHCPNHSIVLAPELFLNGYAYDRLDEAVDITNKAIPVLKKLSKDKTISLTMTTKKNKKYFNTLYIFHNGEIMHTQSKHKLFILNDESKYFSSGDEKDIKIIEINGLKIASLICFELRFIDLWKKIQGADIVLIPAMWGLLRKENFEALTRALAVMNQCFVIASDSANSDMAKSSSIVTPFGNVTKNDDKKIILQDADIKEIKKMRRYMNVGIK
ncbi:MAG: carbon-nitrogen hydrolase family protein, partial [Campylobacterota bacterium]|nr:carbon-nitrogen hydrolase family protein [Campylobacterota bacterium]